MYHPSTNAEIARQAHVEASTNSSSEARARIELKRRSKPIVEEPFELIAAPQSEPATCPG